MGHSKPQLTRALASELQHLRHVEEVVDHSGRVGSVSFKLADDECLSSNRIDNLLPDGWTSAMVVNPDAFTTVYVERE